MRTIFTLVIFSVITNTTSGQKANSPLVDNPWEFTYGQSNTAFAYPNNENSTITQISPTEAVAAVKYPGKKETFGIVKIDDNGKTIWKTMLSSYCLGFGKVNDKLFAFHINYDDKKEPVFLAILNLADGKILSDEAIFQNSQKTMAEFKVENKPNGDFSHFFIRETDVRHFKYSWMINLDKSIQTQKCTSLSFDENGKPQEEINFQIPAKVNFVGSIANSLGETFLAYREGQQLVVSKHNKTGMAVQKLSIATLPSIVTPVIAFEANENNKILIAVSGKDGKKGMYQSYRFDFDDKKVFSGDIEYLNKEYIGSIQWSEREEVKKDEHPTWGDPYPVQILRIRDKIIVVKQREHTFSYNFTSRMTMTDWISGSLVITFYDISMKPLKSIGFNKEYRQQSYGSGQSLRVYSNDNSMEIFGGASGKGNSYLTMFWSIDVDKMEFKKAVIIDRQEIGGFARQLPEGTVSFGKNYLLYYENDFGETTKSKLQKIEL